MSINISCNTSPNVDPAFNAFELVERKGMGHPDTITDGLAEQMSLDYADYCLQSFGAVLHHNLDKVYIQGGLVDQDFGRSRVVEPVTLFLGGRMSRRFAGEDIDTVSIQTRAIEKYLGRVLPHLAQIDGPQISVISRTTDYSHNPYWYNPRSLDDLPEVKQPFSNDTAAMVGYWPLTATENITLALEGFFYDTDERGLPCPRFDFLGQDVKVMSIRNGDALDVTMCIPQIAHLTPSACVYKERIAQVTRDLRSYIDPMADATGLDVALHVNTKDGHNAESYYMLSVGSCLEAGEEGMVGRGNKSRNLISSMRPNTMEAPHGKNPAYFNGKVHGYLAEKTAELVANEFGCSAQVIIQANNGESLYDPAQVCVSTDKSVDMRRITDIVDEQFALGSSVTQRILSERHFLPSTSTYTN